MSNNSTNPTNASMEVDDNVDNTDDNTDDIKGVTLAAMRLLEVAGYKEDSQISPEDRELARVAMVWYSEEICSVALSLVSDATNGNADALKEFEDNLNDDWEACWDDLWSTVSPSGLEVYLSFDDVKELDDESLWAMASVITAGEHLAAAASAEASFSSAAVA